MEQWYEAARPLLASAMKTQQIIEKNTDVRYSCKLDNISQSFVFEGGWCVCLLN